ncbi:UvrD-helicase domain-containing protein [Methylobacterium haplocladii]|nr:UvrD-helicase domain-containing protein [Methylobacterium haplocladii]
MTSILHETGPADTDASADIEISQCLDPAAPRSFFLYAGAGSGKTRSLDAALRTFREAYGVAFRRSGRKIAVITFTNAAAKEIAERVGQDPLFPISTIHSFCWSLIGGHAVDIQQWLLTNLPLDLDDLHEKQRKGRAGRASEDRLRAITAIEARLEWLREPRAFTYNPNGDNFGKDSLSHTEVIKIASGFIADKPSMQDIIVGKYPFLLIDESQDTNKNLMDALIALSEAKKGQFAVGLFGDVMQRIYLDGHLDLATYVPDDWAKPVKRMNHRAPKRVVRLGNALRAASDGQSQLAREDKDEGFVRLFVMPADTKNKNAVEEEIRLRMAELTGDEQWGEATKVKTLTLEHHMAASRCGFQKMFEALRQNSKLSTGLIRGDLPGLRVFTEGVLPLLAYRQAGDEFNVMSHLRRLSPLVSRQALTEASDKQDPLAGARDAVDDLMEIDFKQASNLQVLERVAKTGLFDIPSSLQPFIEPEQLSVVTPQVASGDDEGEEEDGSTSSLAAWRQFLESPFSQMAAYAEYVSDKGPFGTHQGVKGLEFERVFVILDDSEARGFLFSYERLFGAKLPPASRRASSTEPAESSEDRTRRLLYVTCTRTTKSLALAAYSENPEALARGADAWFEKDEVARIDNR